MNRSNTVRGAPLQRALAAGAGLLVLAGAVTRFDPRPDLGWDATVLPLAALGLALLAIAAAIRTPWLRAALNGGLYLVALAAGLQLVDAERYANYPHFAPLSGLGLRALWLAPALAQWGLALVALRPVAGAFDRDRIGWTRVLLLFALLAFAAAIPTQSLQRFVGETGIALVVSLGALLNLWCFARAMPAGGLARARARLERWVSVDPSAGGVAPLDRSIPWIAAGLVTIGAALFSRVVLGGVPHIDDSVSNLFQAKTFALGRLFLPAPPDSAAFQVQEVLIDGDRWFGYASPGWPAVLAAGVRIGLPWIVNPVLGGLAILLAHRLLRRLHGNAVANLATVLLAASPWLLFMSASMMGHPLALVLALLVLVTLADGRPRSPGRGLLAGLGLGALALTRPLDAAIVGLAAGLWTAGRNLEGRGLARTLRSAAVTLVPLAITAAAVTGLGLAYNHALTGDAFYTPQMMWTDRAWGPGTDRYGFGPGIGIRAWPGIDPLPGHGPADVALNLNKNLFTAGTDLFGWAGGSLILLFLACTLPARLREFRLETLLLVTCIAAYSGYWFAGGPDLGPRYWYIAIPAFAALSLAGAVALARRTRQGTRIGAAIALASLAAVLVFVPWRAATRYYRYRDIGNEIRSLEKTHDWNDALIFVRADGRESYQAAFNALDPRLETGHPVYARDSDDPASRAAVLRHFPERDVWIVGTGPGPDRRLRVLAGPLPPGTVDR